MGRIVVGIDGSESARRALSFALGLAKQGDDTIDVIHVWERVPVAMYAAPSTRPSHDPEQIARKLIAREVAFVMRRHGDRELSKERVQPIVVEGRPSAVLIQASKGASLLAVGSGRADSLVVPRLGSVSLEVVRHARCPVIVMPPNAIETRMTGGDVDDDHRELVGCVG